MKFTFQMIAVVAILASALVSCDTATRDDANDNYDDTSYDARPSDRTDNAMGDIVPRREDIMTKAEQDTLSPEEVLRILDVGNARFMTNNLTARDHSAMVRKAVKGQYPKAIVLSCVDSRVPVEDVFDRGIGDMFVARVAGNFINEDMLGSMEFACKVAGSKLVLVMGHEHCGAVKSAVDDVKLGNITPMLAKIRPAVEAVEYDGDRTSKNQEFVSKVCERNVRMAVDQIRERSQILREMEENGDIFIRGAVYDMDDGSVDFLSGM